MLLAWHWQAKMVPAVGNTNTHGKREHEPMQKRPSKSSEGNDDYEDSYGEDANEIAEMQAVHRRNSEVAGATKLQALFRRKAARDELVEKLGEDGTCLAMPGTVQGRTGFYETWDKYSGSSVIGKFNVAADGTWTLRARFSPSSSLAWPWLTRIV